MGKVVDHWNEVLQMSEQDLDNANNHIIHLEEDISQKAQQLEGAEARLLERERHIQDFEERWKNVEDDQANAFRTNEGLTGQVESLREELTKSRTRVNTATEKCKTYKEKINQAIHEQQQLYQRSRSYYESVLHELKAEEQKKATRSTEVDNALELSQKKREEMHRAFNEFQASARKEAEQSKSSERP